MSVEIDQLIFQKLFHFFRRKKKDEPVMIARRMLLEDMKQKLTIIARALTGDGIDIHVAEREGGWKGNKFLLPERMDKFSSLELNIKYYIFRMFYLATQRRLSLNFPQDESHTMSEAQEQALATSESVLAILFEEYPALKPVFESLDTDLEKITEEGITPDKTWLFGRWYKMVPLGEGDALENVSDVTAKKQPDKITTELKAKPSDEVETIAVDKKAQEDYVLTHNFEKVETAEEHDGVWRDFDGDDTLQNDAEALNELNLKNTVRVDDPVHSVYQADFISNINVAESKEADGAGLSYAYDEWDFKAGQYRINYCNVYPQKVSGWANDYYVKTIEQNKSMLLGLRKMFARLNNRLEQIRRQNAGEEFDLDALIEMYTDIHARQTPTEKIYLTKRRKKKDLAILFLLDLSLSSDGYVRGNRILDVEKQVTILFGEVLNEYFIEFEVDGFYSKTRNYCSFTTLKGFDESWQTARNKIGAAQPSGYTRIGPALRHAGMLLQKRDARKKWLVLLSDGKPNDYDKYEGKYGIADVKQALRELNSNNVNAYAVAIEENAKYYLPQMFGKNHYNILSSPVEMLQSLTQLYEKIEKS